MSTKPEHFRADIGGVRALSILAVLWFHFALGLPGGYTGVDVFFVLSGFLITSNIVRDLQAQRFSFRRFWERRIKRLMPALVPVTLFAVGCGWWVLSPLDYRELGKSLAFQSLASSNLYFWKVWDTGYFAEDVETRLMLHTWSLSVEEQFYLFLPPLLWFCFRRQALRGIWRGLVATAVLSFGLSIWLTPSHQSFAFYGLFTRAWELALGGLTALTMGRWSTVGVVRREGICWLALSVLLAGFWGLQSSPNFPGSLALIPCLPTAVLLALAPGTRLGRCLSWGPMVFVGELSYSLYLWHWPLWSLAFYAGFITPDSPVLWRLGLVLLCFVVAYIAWRFVETPCRFSSRISAWTVLGSYLVLTWSAAGLIVVGKGLPQRWSPQALQYFADKDNWSSLRSFELQRYRDGSDLLDCGAFLGDPSLAKLDYLVWGDSHAKSLFPVLDRLSRAKGLRGYAVSLPSSPPLWVEGTFPGASTQLADKSLQKAWNRVPQDARERGIGKLVLVGRWTHYYHGRPQAALRETLTKLRDLNMKVYFVGDVPRQSFHPPRRLGVATRLPFLSTAPSGPDRVKELALFEEVQSWGLSTCLDPAPSLLELPSLVVAGHSAYRDADHLTEYGSQVIGPLLEQILK
jgi:peptidoglycan/LPS O-acetylase OafA/YrhL